MAVEFEWRKSFTLDPPPAEKDRLAAALLRQWVDDAELLHQPESVRHTPRFRGAFVCNPDHPPDGERDLLTGWLDVVELLEDRNLL